MRKLVQTAAVIIFGFSSILTAFAVENDVDFSIRFIDRRIYYAEADPVNIQITITNNSPETYRFKLADDRAFSIDFDIRSMTNRQLASADALIYKRTVNQQVFFREIAIEPGESFSFVEDLREFINLKQPGSFRVQAKVYPELYRAASSVIASNYLNLNLRPAPIIGPDGIPLEMDVATGAVLVRRHLPPDEVVSYMLKARQESQWEKFFLYLDLESMLARDALRKRKWTAENEDGRRRMTAEYRLELQSATVDQDISVIPYIFDIERTEYSGITGKVTVLEKFRGIAYTEIRRYVYDLEQRDNIWFIVNYSVQGLGTEANQ